MGEQVEGSKDKRIPSNLFWVKQVLGSALLQWGDGSTSAPPRAQSVTEEEEREETKGQERVKNADGLRRRSGVWGGRWRNEERDEDEGKTQAQLPQDGRTIVHQGGKIMVSSPSSCLAALIRSARRYRRWRF